MFGKLLIANRGEIACRIARTAKRMGVATVAVYSEADRDARHVRSADESIYIGAAPAAESYLSIERIVRAAKATGAQAVHPGYGFLSESAAFAREVEAAGLTFVGPGPRAIERLGDKVSARALARENGLSVVPGSDGVVGSPDEVRAVARAVGYPVMLKAAAGGGGRGMRVVSSDDEVDAAWQACRREAASFADDRLYVEKRIADARHIEVQVLGDAHGNVLHLGERDCSLQRRHQKLVEEAPATFLDAETRAAMCAQAVALAKAAEYRSAGTVEFVVDGARGFSFLEMNTRLQVEHPVTELTTGIDIVEWMMRIAAGESLPWPQDEVRVAGHAIECRINAEDPERRFAPSVGRLSRLSLPQEVDGELRVDAGVEEGDSVGAHYDSLVAKVIVAAPDRADAIRRMSSALDATLIRGIASTAAFHAGLLRHPVFLAGEHTTAFVDTTWPEGYRRADPTAEDVDLFVAVAAVAHRRTQECATRAVGAVPAPSYRLEDDLMATLGDADFPLRVREMRGTHRVTTADGSFDVAADWRFHHPVVRGTLRDRPFVAQVERCGLSWQIAHAGLSAQVRVLPRRAWELLRHLPKPVAAASDAPDVRAPMGGVLIAFSVSPGERVRRGDPVATIEAMKMENVVHAERDGLVDGLLAQPGETVVADQPILRLTDG